MDELRELLESLYICNGNIFGREINGNIKDTNPVFDEPCEYNFTESKRYEVIDGFSTEGDEGFVRVLHDNLGGDNYVELLTSLFKSELDAGKKLALFILRIEINEIESRIYQLPLEFYVEVVISKENNNYKFKYCLSDDNCSILVTDTTRSEVIKELAILSLKRYRLRIEYEQNNKQSTRIETIEEHSRKRNNSKTTSDRQKINNLLGF